jgi:N-formylmaleamate deformylase
MKRPLIHLLFLAILAIILPAELTAGELPFTAKVSGHGSPVIFIPGYTCGGAVWDATVAKFSASNECHVLTIRGFGGEAPSEKPFHLDAVKDGIKTYILQQKLDRVILVGHSMGGVLAMWVASEMQDHLAGIVIVDAVPFVSALGDSTAKEKGFDSTAAAQFEAMTASQPHDMRMKYGVMAAKHYCLDSTFHETIGTWGATSDPHTSATLLMDMAGMDLRDEMAKIRVPVLSLVAWEPGYGMPQETVRSMWAKQYALTPQLTMHVAPSSRHFIMYDAPDWFYSELNTFIAQAVPAAKK